MLSTSIVDEGVSEVLDVLGPTIQFLRTPSENPADYCVLRGVLPAGTSVPLHSHPDDESFFVLSGAVDVLVHREGANSWAEVKSGQFVHIPGSCKHAFRNRSAMPVVQLITTTARLGKFFLEIGRPVTEVSGPPSREALEKFVRTAARYGHWLGSPAENAAVGIRL